MASGWFSSSSSDPTRPPDVRFQVAEEKPHGLYLQPSSGGSRSATNRSAAPTSSAYVDTTHSKTHVHNASLFDVGILKDTLVPSLTLHSGLALIAYGAARYTNRVEAKDWLWPSGQVVNAWWSAVGRRLAQGYTVSQAFSRLSWHERVILTGVTLWGGRLFYRIVRRSLQRGGDDPRYAEVKKEEGFWNSALFKVFVPEAFFQMLISLPFTAPFRHEGAVMTGYHPFVQMFAVGLFSSGLALETLADYQLDQFKAEGNKGIMREGVWSIVRNPNYLGDALVHISFIVMLYGSDMLAPVELLGPAANYAFLRFFGGDAEKEKHQERRYSASQPDKFRELEKFRADKNAFWPSVDELSNKWLWTVLGVGGLGIAVEQTLRALH
ncbi:hypothetical protein AA0120_g4226 [Alternaria tenuissima]|uniref:Steroid 5-alpha reductase C-terminal domain-containing protein n=1 Tax=Alternaria tenuissima TaxID=119927 RepID=A0A4Q4MGP3_9PLEO|nr:DUF1295-like protein [Alternaria alternata]RYN50775.1 hypothetical protein AA0114_g5814 [Alternaria tenuissima]RYN93665.1 hypothetical protein AA0120_g4226 [Alternaria tenuissima]